MNGNLTKLQISIMETLYDVATHEGGGIILKNRCHASAHGLIEKGLVKKTDRFPYRPHYQLTEAGFNLWAERQQPIILCDGCGKQNKIVDSLNENGKQVNICESCESRGGYICFNCPDIHFAQYACPKQVISFRKSPSTNSASLAA